MDPARSVRLQADRLAFLLILLLAACSTPDDRQAEPTEPVLAPVSLPDLSRADEAVQAQVRERHAELVTRMEAGAPEAELGAAYGDLGMLLHAAEYLDAAEPAYLNAQTLMPRDPRWPYSLGLLYQGKGRPGDAEQAFRRVLELAPDDVPALVRLGRLLLDRGDAAAAEPLFRRARTAAPSSVAVLAGLGQAALARGDHASAARVLEEALTAAPEASSLRAPLANAYRALGRAEEAEAQARLWRNTDIPFADPRRQEIDLAIESGLAYELRGLRALAARNWQEAAALFRTGLELSAPESALRRSLHHKLGTALWMGGETREAVEQFETVTRLAPEGVLDEPSSKAYYSLGVVRGSEGRAAEAIRLLEQALAYGPWYGEARIALGDVLRQTGRPEAALAHYREAVQIDPRSTPAIMAYAVTLMELQRWAGARAWLEDAARRQPEDPGVRYLLARVLASAPDGAVRDGSRALALAESLAREHRTAAVGETLAMALAETGDYAEAARVQRGVLEAIDDGAAPPPYVARLRQDLQRYERGQPSRTPWTGADPVHPSS